MRINTNVAALSAHRNLSKTGVGLNKSIERLSSGLRINRAGDDAAGLVISEKLRAESSSLRQAARNAQDGISFVQTVEGALDEVSSMLTRMRDLVVQHENGTQDRESKLAIQAEFDALESSLLLSPRLGCPFHHALCMKFHAVTVEALWSWIAARAMVVVVARIVGIGLHCG